MSARLEDAKGRIEEREAEACLSFQKAFLHCRTPVLLDGSVKFFTH